MYVPYCSNMEDCYWVGKASLRGWRKMAIKQIETAEKSIDMDTAQDGKILSVYCPKFKA